MKTEEQLELIKSIQQEWIERMLKGDFVVTSIGQPNGFNTREVKFYISGKIPAHCHLYTDSKKVICVHTDDLELPISDADAEALYNQFNGYVATYDKEYLDIRIAELQAQREQLNNK